MDAEIKMATFMDGVTMSMQTILDRMDRLDIAVRSRPPQLKTPTSTEEWMENNLIQLEAYLATADTKAATDLVKEMKSQLPVFKEFGFDSAFKLCKDGYNENALNQVRMLKVAMDAVSSRRSSTGNSRLLQSQVAGIESRSNIICERCGNVGHEKIKCFAKRHKEGHILT